MTPTNYAPATSTDQARKGGLRTALAAFFALFAVATAFAVGPAASSASAAPAGLHVLATPRWAKAPEATTILTAKVKKLSAYQYKAGKAPSDRYGVLIRLANPTPQHIKLVMTGYGEENGYYLALLDVIPNNTFAWVKASDVTVTKTPYSILISESQHRLLLFSGTKVVSSFPVAVGCQSNCMALNGKPSTPTPLGYFFVNNIVHNAGPDYGNIIISTSGFSEVYKTFGDGDAAVGIHGTDEPASVGHSVSHGCVRLHTADALFLSRYMKPGVQVVIQK